MKYLSLAFILLLVGCGGAKTLNTKYIDDKFSFGDQAWQVKLPIDWRKLPLEADVIYMARKSDENFVILEREKKEVPISQQILESAESDFFQFEIEEFAANQWKFQGKPRASLPLRVFWQKVHEIPGSNKFLLGSCSYQVTKNESAQNECAVILNSWEIYQEPEENSN